MPPQVVPGIEHGNHLFHDKIYYFGSIGTRGAHYSYDPSPDAREPFIPPRTPALAISGSWKLGSNILEGALLGGDEKLDPKGCPLQAEVLPVVAKKVIQLEA